MFTSVQWQCEIPQSSGKAEWVRESMTADMAMGESSRRSYSYWDVMRTPRWRWWASCTVGARLPVAMAPLGLVFAGHQVSGGYALGGVLVAAHTIGEAVVAPVAGTAMDRWSVRRGLKLGLAAEAVLFLSTAGLVSVRAPIAALIVLAALAGAVPAGATGGLRSVLTPVVGRARLDRALSLDAVLNQGCWAAAPLIVTALSQAFSAAIAVTAIAVPAVLGAIAAFGLPGTLTSEHRPHGRRSSLAPLLRLLSRTLVLTGALRLLLGALTVVALPLFDAAGAVSYAGVALAAYATSTAIGGMLYSARRHWPGSRERQADILLTALGAVVAAAFLVRQPLALVLVYGAAGLLEGPVMIARSLHMEGILPPDRRATGFSMQYAAIGWGFAMGGLALTQLIGSVGPNGVLGVTGLIIVAVAAVAVFGSKDDVGESGPGQ
jgi:hypothetical protein